MLSISLQKSLKSRNGTKDQYVVSATKLRVVSRNVTVSRNPLHLFIIDPLMLKASWRCQAKHTRQGNRNVHWRLISKIEVVLNCNGQNRIAHIIRLSEVSSYARLHRNVQRKRLVAYRQKYRGSRYLFQTTGAVEVWSKLQEKPLTFRLSFIEQITERKRTSRFAKLGRAL